MKARLWLILSALVLFLGSCTQMDNPSSDSEFSDPSLSDPSDIRTQNEVLADYFSTYDGPVVVQLVGTTPFLFPEQIAEVWNAPHVVSVICPSIVHWLDASEDGSLVMIGQSFPDLKPEAIAEGRWFENERECCVNRAEYERLLADPKAAFTGLGGTVTYAEQIRDVGRGMNMKRIIPISKSFTVVGIVGDEGEYAEAAFGKHHMYTVTDSVVEMLGNYQANRIGFESKIDLSAYALFHNGYVLSCMPAYRTDPEDENRILLRCLEDTIYTEEEWRARYDSLPCNAGYTVEVTLDSGKSYEVFCDYWRAKQFVAMSMRELEERRLRDIADTYEQYEKKSREYPGLYTKAWLEETLSRLQQDPLVTRLMEEGGLDDWYVCAFSTPYIVRPLRVE